MFQLVGRGNLNRLSKILILIYYFRLNFLLEYLLEYHLRDFLDSRLYVVPKTIHSCTSDLAFERNWWELALPIPVLVVFGGRYLGYAGLSR